MVDACAVLCELIGGNGVSLHIVRISMATSTSGRHIDRIDRITWIAGRSQVVDTVAIGADGNLGIASRPALTMHAGVVLR